MVAEDLCTNRIAHSWEHQSSNINYNSFYFFRLFWVPLVRTQSIDALYDLWHNWPQQTAEDGNPSRSRGEFVISFYDNKTINVKIELCEMKHEEEMKGTFTRREPWFTTRQPSESRYLWIIFQSIIYQSQKQRVFVIRIPDYVTIGSIFCLLKTQIIRKSM